jgi:hypothetical protein
MITATVSSKYQVVIANEGRLGGILRINDLRAELMNPATLGLAQVGLRERI